MPSRDAARAPAPARPIIEPIDATAKAPLETPSANTAATNTRGSAERKPLAAIPAKDNPDAAQPPAAHRRKEPKIGQRVTEEAATATPSMPVSIPPCCKPASFVVTPGVIPNTSPANGSTSSSWALKASIDTKMKMVKPRAAGSFHWSLNAAVNPGLPGAAVRCAGGAAAQPSTPQTARTATRNAVTLTVAVTAIRRSCENGSRKCPARGAESAKPRIIIIQTADAAAARPAGVTRVASIARTEVPAAPTPTPTRRKEIAAKAIPSGSDAAARAVPHAAPTAPSASAAIPPMIQGVRRPPMSDP